MIIMAASSRAASRAASRASHRVSVPGVRIDFTGARSKDAMLQVVAKALRLPRHFGMNLDALHDCLTDLTFSAGTNITLVKLAHTPGGDAVFGVFRAAARYWFKQGSKVTLARE